MVRREFQRTEAKERPVSKTNQRETRGAARRIINQSRLDRKQHLQTKMTTLVNNRIDETKRIYRGCRLDEAVLVDEDATAQAIRCEQECSTFHPPTPGEKSF
jgi:hypothetical protein